MTILQIERELKRKIEWAPTPSPMTTGDIIGFVMEGLRDLFGSTNREDEYNMEWAPESDITLKLNEFRYVLVCAEISFYKKNQDDVSKLVGYTTDALSVTNADKPYANLKDKIAELELERRRIFYKLTGGMHVVVDDDEDDE